MITDFENINGHRYQVTRDDAGNIVDLVGADVFPPPVAIPNPNRVAALALVTALQAPGGATPLQQQQALALLLQALYQ